MPAEHGSQAGERIQGMRHLLSVVIPAYDEEEGIGAIIERVLAITPNLAASKIGLELIVVDDGSRDGTCERVRQYPQVRLVRHGCNRGYGAALKTGFAAAQGDWLAFLDADGTYPPEYLGALCQALEENGGADLVVGSRRSGATSEMPFLRRIGNAIWATMVTLLGCQRVIDPASGMRVFRREVLDRLYPLPDGLNFTPVMSTRAIHEGVRLKEVPIPYQERQGRSKLKVVRDGVRFMSTILWTVLAYNPVRLLGSIGVALFGLGALIGAAFVVLRLSGVTRLGPWGVASLFLAAFGILGGFDLFALGATFNYLVSLFHERPIRQGLFGKPLFRRPLDRQFWWMGILAILGGFGLGLFALIMGVNGWEIERLWFYLLVGTMSLMLGVHLLIFWVIMRVLEELSQRQVRVQADLEGAHDESFENRGKYISQRLVFEPPPRADIGDLLVRRRPDTAVDILFVNPPAPDGGIWIRSQHRVGRRSREGMIWPQADLAQMAALFPDKRVTIIDAIAERMSWAAFEALLDRFMPRVYVTQVTAPTLQNDMYGVFLAKARGAWTVAFGTHVTPMPVATLRDYPALDFVLYGEPELTLRELVETLEETPPSARVSLDKVAPELARNLNRLYLEADPEWRPVAERGGSITERLATIKGLAWRRAGEIAINPPRPLIADLDALPLPRHDLLPLRAYRAPLVKGPYTFIVTSRGCPAGCRFCIKHVSYGRSVRFRSPEHILAEVEQLVRLGVRSLHMYADLFTLNRDHVIGICQGLLDRGLKVRWTCNSRVDFVDREMLHLMARSGCWMISWGIESGDEGMLRRMQKGTTLAQVEQALRWSREAGIRNWGYFIIGLPGETEVTIRRTIDLAKRLPLDLALFHIAAPHPGTPFFFEVVENGWFRPGTRWEDVDMDRSTVLDYPDLPAEALERWAQRAFREWALRPGPLFTYCKMLISSPRLWRAAFSIGLESLAWLRGKVS